ncbi:hypothetical protein BsWGS_18461 [Bradybaena similaris]
MKSCQEVSNSCREVSNSCREVVPDSMHSSGLTLGILMVGAHCSHIVEGDLNTCYILSNIKRIPNSYQSCPHITGEVFLVRVTPTADGIPAAPLTLQGVWAGTDNDNHDPPVI